MANSKAKKQSKSKNAAPVAKLNKNKIAQELIAVATLDAKKIGERYVRMNEANNGKRKALAWQTANKLVSVVTPLSQTAFMRVRKAYEDAGVSRKTAQVHFAIAKAIGTGKLVSPEWDNTNESRAALPSMRDIAKGYTAQGEVKEPKMPKPITAGASNKNDAAVHAEPSSGVPSAYVTDAKETRQAIAALALLARRETPPTGADWQAARRTMQAVLSSISVKDEPNF